MFRLALRARRSASSSALTNLSPANSRVALLERNARAGNNVKALTGRFSGAYRYRVGDLRVVYSIDDRSETVFVITIAYRRDVYE